jgi:hypothetical protein
VLAEFTVGFNDTIRLDRSQAEARLNDANERYVTVRDSGAVAATVAAASELDVSNTAGTLALLEQELDDLRDAIRDDRVEYENALQDLESGYEVLRVPRQRHPGDGRGASSWTRAWSPAPTPPA